MLCAGVHAVLCACFSSIIRLELMELMDAKQNKRRRSRVLHAPQYEYSDDDPSHCIISACRMQSIGNGTAVGTPPAWQEWPLGAGVEGITSTSSGVAWPGPGVVVASSWPLVGVRLSISADRQLPRVQCTHVSDPQSTPPTRPDLSDSGLGLKMYGV